MKENDQIYYEGYVNSQWKKIGALWRNEERIKLNKSRAVIEMNPNDNNKKYPIGLFFANMFDPSG